MEENNKVKLKVSIWLIVILAMVIIISIIAIILNREPSIDEKNEVSQSKVDATNTELNYANNEFDLAFLKMENNKKNMIYSPLSIKYALKMLNDGAKGNTKAQIEKVIGDINLPKYDNIENVLSLSNALYIRNTYSQYVKDEYKNNLLKRYNAEIKYDAFENAKNINTWIEDKTFGQIKDMLSDDIVNDEGTKMVLINALAIDMKLADKFDKKNTYGDTFYLENGNTMKATMMNKETTSDKISYYKEDNITVLSMDLQEHNNEQMEFVVIMPNDNLSNYVKKFSMKDLENITNNLELASKTKYGLDISMPRFLFDYDLNLKKDLENLGISDAFSSLADFSNMSSRKLYVSAAMHKANIDFAEEGVKAAASTAFAVSKMSVLTNPETPIEINIDKPFMYFIRDKKTNQIWFVGTVYEPNSWEKDQSDY